MVYKVPKNEMEKIIDGDAESLITHGKEAAKRVYDQYGNNLKITQFRQIFGNFRQIQRSGQEIKQVRQENGEIKQVQVINQQAYRKLQMMKPKLAYQATRGNKQLSILRDNLPDAIDLVGESWERFQNMMDFFEAFLAYLIARKGNDK